MPDETDNLRRRRTLRISKARLAKYLQAVRTVASADTGFQAMWDVSVIGAHFRCSVLNEYLDESYGGVVQSGPFKGMKYIREAAGSLYGPKIVGCYEAELHARFETLDRYARFVDVGCAEGYYAVGARLASETLEVHAFDNDSEALERCRALAELNGVADRLHLGGECTAEMLAGLAAPGTLVLVDIEGAEADLLPGVPADRLALCDIIVETHMSRQHGMTLQAMLDLLSPTHEVEVIQQRPRDWAADPVLRSLDQYDRLLATWEGRGPEPWVFARSRVVTP